MQCMMNMGQLLFTLSAPPRHQPDHGILDEQMYFTILHPNFLLPSHRLAIYFVIERDDLDPLRQSCECNPDLIRLIEPFRGPC